MLPNVIVGGAQKAGTTSLFRYLSSHPSVCPSKIKEIHFFLKHKNLLDASAINEYHSFFPAYSDKQFIFLEASPMYLSESSQIASIMHHTLPDIKLIFILREPISILLSYIKFKSVIDGVNYPVELFSSLARGEGDEAYADDEISIKNAFHHLKSGCFVNSLKDFLTVYPREQIGVFFFDELSNNTSMFMEKICRFLDIDPDFYDQFPFRIENKTRSYRSLRLHIAATRWNMKLEPVFNRFPSIRNTIRSFYHFIFENKKVANIETKSGIADLSEYYTKSNKELACFLKQTYPDLEFPVWLNFDDGYEIS